MLGDHNLAPYNHSKNKSMCLPYHQLVLTFKAKWPYLN